MKQEEFKHSQQNTGDRLASDSTRCPLIKVQGANEHGIIVQSRRSFEVGSAFALGIHVQIPECRQTEFVSAETIIVESTPRLNRRGDLVYQVTMLFSEITRDDRDLLVLMSHDESMIAAAAPPTEKTPLADSPVPTRTAASVASLN